MTVTVLVPDDEGMQALAGVPGVSPLRFDWGGRLPDRADQAEVLIPGFHPPDADLLARLPSVKLIQLLSAGADGWREAVPAGTLLSTCRGAHGGSAAEWVIAVLLATYRRLDRIAEQQRERVWLPGATETLQDKRVLIVGAGDLGRQLRRRLEPFDSVVTMVGLAAREGVHGVDELPGLLGGQDAVVLLTPLTARTERMADAAFLAAMPDGAVLVNAARGAVVDTAALLAELRTGRLRACLDVTDPEPLPPDHPLWTAPGVLISAHVAGSVSGAARRAYAVAAAEIARYVGGELPENLVHGEY